MSKSYFLILLFSLLASIRTCAQAPSADALFVQAPREVMPLLDMPARLDLLDLYNNGLPAKVENNCGGQSELLSKTPSSIRLRTSEVGEWQMDLLTSPSDTLLLTLHTLQAGGRSTRIALFDSHWKADHRQLPLPSVADFWCPPISMDANALLVWRKQVEMLPVCAQWNDTTHVLTFTLNTEGVDLDSRKEVDKCICPVKYSLEPVNGRFAFILK